MRWFKHFVNSTSDPDFMEAETIFKTAAPYVFWRSVEILAREEALDEPLVMDFHTFSHWFPSVSKPKLRKILQHFNKTLRKDDQKPRISCSFFDGKISIFCNKLKDISSEYTQKVRRNSGECPENVRPRSKKKEVDKEVRRRILDKPSLEQVSNYIKEKNYSVDAMRWYSHYESNGWKVGKNPMKNWQAAVRTWHLKNKEKAAEQRGYVYEKI